MIVFAAFACLIAFSWAEPRIIEPPLRFDFPPPENISLSERNVVVYQSWMTMPVDHFDPQNTDTFLMRYMYNDEFFTEEGDPIFIMVGGEWTINAAWLLTGNLHQMARENRGFQIYTEHRYYGQTLPYASFTTENLRFLNVDQALADLAYFIRDIKVVMPQLSKSKVILFGCSYAANMVIWFKQRYPHLAEGVVASCGPILGKVDFTGYLEVVHSAFLSEGGEECISIIRQGIADTITAMETEDGRSSLEATYRLCHPLNYDNPYDLGYFSGLISWTFSSSTQTARPGSIIDFCRNFETTVYGTTPMEKVAGYINTVQGLTTCWSINYEAYVQNYMQNTNSRAWYYQTCTEYGYYQTAPRSGTVFDELTWLSVDFYVNLCERIFGERFNETFVYDAVDRVNLMFGGLEPNANNTINIHGGIDPWHSLGVHDRDIKEGSPTFTVPRASHCFDMQNWLPTDTPPMTRVQQETRRIVARWLADD